MSETVRVKRRRFLGAAVGAGLTASLTGGKVAFAGGKAKPVPFRDVPIDRVTAGRFAPHLGDVFRIHADAKRYVDVKLASFHEFVPQGGLAGGGVGKGMRRPFTLVFQSAKMVVLPQETYKVQHPKMGTVSLFLVPSGPHDGPTAYAATFS